MLRGLNSLSCPSVHFLSYPAGGVGGTAACKLGGLGTIPRCHYFYIIKQKSNERPSLSFSSSSLFSLSSVVDDAWIWYGASLGAGLFFIFVLILFLFNYWWQIKTISLRLDDVWALLGSVNGEGTVAQGESICSVCGTSQVQPPASPNKRVR